MCQIISTIFIYVFLLVGCSSLRRPVVEEKDDGEIRATLEISRGKFRVGEMVEIYFTLENISNDVLVLDRKDGPIRDLVISCSHLERHWSSEGLESQSSRYLILEPREASTIKWELSGLETSLYTLSGIWWSADTREVAVVVIFEYGPSRN